MNNPLPVSDQTDSMLPTLWTVATRRQELADTFTLSLTPDTPGPSQFQPGQFNMLYLFGTGEVPISISGDPENSDQLIHTIRAVGAVTEGLERCQPGDQIGVRGPFGTAWPVEEAFGDDIVVITGGIGLAPLRPAIYQILTHRERFGKVNILYGARTPSDILYRNELAQWRARFDLNVEVIVDHADANWLGRVGVVTKLIDMAQFDPHETTALVCGPEVMMRYVVQGLQDRGLADERMFLSMERNMKCAIGHCGHCQLGGLFVCKDGPVFPYPTIKQAFQVREL